MPTNQQDAHDSIRSRFFLTWKDWVANGEPVDIRKPSGERKTPIVLLDSVLKQPYVLEVAFQNVERRNPNDLSRHWCRLTIDPVDNRQRTFRTSDPSIGDGKARYTEQGVIIVQMFFSKSAFKGNDDRRLSVIARNIFRSRNVRGNEVWYRNADIRYLNPEESWIRSNVIAEYEFDEII